LSDINNRKLSEDWGLKVYVIAAVPPAKARLIRDLLAKSIATNVDWKFSSPQDEGGAADIKQLVAASIVVAVWMQDADGGQVAGQLEWAVRDGKATIALVETGVAPFGRLNPESLIEFDCRDPFPAVARLDVMRDRVEVGLFPRDAYKAVFADLTMVLLGLCLD
jgi:hypothetical protein